MKELACVALDKFKRNSPKLSKSEQRDKLSWFGGRSNCELYSLKLAYRDELDMRKTKATVFLLPRPPPSIYGLAVEERTASIYGAKLSASSGEVCSKRGFLPCDDIQRPTQTMQFQLLIYTTPIPRGRHEETKTVSPALTARTGNSIGGRFDIIPGTSFSHGERPGGPLIYILQIHDLSKKDPWVQYYGSPSAATA